MGKTPTASYPPHSTFKMSAQPLFTVPILSTDKTTSGTVVCTTPSPGVYILTFTSPPDNRLVTSFCQSIILALDILEFSYPHGVVITTSGIQKFFSNGLDLEHASNTEGHEREEKRDKETLRKDDERREVGRKRVAEWEKNASKAKL